MNGYVPYFTCLIFVILFSSCLSSSSLDLAEKNYRRIQRRKLLSKLYKKHKKKFKSGWKHTLEKVNIISDLKDTAIVSVNEINGREICEITGVDINKIYEAPSPLKIGSPVDITSGGCCCNPKEDSTSCQGPFDGTDNTYFGSVFWDNPGSYMSWINSAGYPQSGDGAGYKQYGRQCDSAKIRYETNNYYDIDIHLEMGGLFSPPNFAGNATVDGTPGRSAGAKKASVIPNPGVYTSPSINYVVVVKQLQKRTIVTTDVRDGTTQSLIKNEIFEYMYNENDSPYGGCCDSVSGNSGNDFPYIKQGETHVEEIALTEGGTTPGSAGFEYSMVNIGQLINVKAGDRITFKSSYGRLNDKDNPSLKNAIGVTYELGYYDATTSDWVHWEGQDWDGNYVKYEGIGCVPWWTFTSVNPAYGGDGSDAAYGTLNHQYKTVCKGNEKRWMPMALTELLAQDEIELQIRLKIPKWNELKPVYNLYFGNDGVYKDSEYDGSRAHPLSSSNSVFFDIIWQNQHYLLYYLQFRGLYAGQDSGYTDGDDFADMTDTMWEKGIDGTTDIVVPTQDYIDFQKIVITKPTYETFDIELDYPSSDNHYFLVDVELLAWHDSQGQIRQCPSHTKDTPGEVATSCGSYTLDVISSELIETACLPNYFKNYKVNDAGVFEGKCKLCITACEYAQFVDTGVCTGYGRTATDVCLTVDKGNYCPDISGTPGSFTTTKQLPDCDGVCNGLEESCSWMYGYVKIRNPWSQRTPRPEQDYAQTVDDCGYYCGKWRGGKQLRMDNGFPEFMFVPLHPDEPICRLLKGHELIRQCGAGIDYGGVGNGDGTKENFVWDPTCTTGAAAGAKLEPMENNINLMDIFYMGATIATAAAETEAFQTVLETLPHSESCLQPVPAGEGSLLSQYNQHRTIRSKESTWERPSS